MSTEVDARDAYLAEAKRLAQLHACEKALESLKSDDAPDSEKTLHTLMEHLRNQPEGYRLLRSTTHEERSFPEDATSDNGNYYNTCCECGRQFTGHKRRIVCKVCINEKPMIAAAQEGK